MSVAQYMALLRPITLLQFPAPSGRWRPCHSPEVKLLPRPSAVDSPRSSPAWRADRAPTSCTRSGYGWGRLIRRRRSLAMQPMSERRIMRPEISETDADVQPDYVSRVPTRRSQLCLRAQAIADHPLECPSAELRGSHIHERKLAFAPDVGC